MGRVGRGKSDRNQKEIVGFVRSIPGAYVHILSGYPGQLAERLDMARRLEGASQKQLEGENV